MKRTLGIRYYIRYADDFLVLGPEKDVLHRILADIEEILHQEGLALHPTKCRVYPARVGVDFLGFVSFPGYRRLRKSSARRFVRRSRTLLALYPAGMVERDRVLNSIGSWIAHAKFGKTYALRRDLLRPLVLGSPIPRTEQGTREKG